MQFHFERYLFFIYLKSISVRKFWKKKKSTNPLTKFYKTLLQEYVS